MVDVIQRQFDRPSYATATVATNGVNGTKITITARNANGAPVPRASFDVILSDSATGAGLTAVTASGAVANDGVSGADIGVPTAKKALQVQANANGVYALSITDTAKTPFKVAVLMDGLTSVVATLVTASYG